MSTRNRSSLALTNYKLRRTFNKCVKSNENQLQVKKTGKSFDSSVITAFRKCVAINKVNVECEEIIIPAQDRIFINFDDYNLGPIDDNGIQQGGWSGGAQTGFTNNDPPYEKIVNTISYISDKSWCLGGKNMYGSPGQGTPFTPALNIETNSVDETAFNESIKGKKFNYSFWVNAADTGVPTAISIYNGSYQGNDRTGLNINIEKQVGGIRIFSYSYDNGSYPQNELATGLEYDKWHKVEASVTYAADGDPENDVFIYTINDGTPQQVLSWINVWRKANSFPYSYGTRLKFAGNNTDPSGIYFDDILLEVETSVPECKSCCCKYVHAPSITHSEMHPMLASPPPASEKEVMDDNLQIQYNTLETDISNNYINNSLKVLLPPSPPSDE